MPLPSPAPMEPSQALAGRVILITGATGGLGAPLSRACAAQGATVVLHGRIERKLDVLYDEIVAAGHPEPVILPLDLAKAGACYNGRRAWGHSSAGRALAWHAIGRGFESPWLHQTKTPRKAQAACLRFFRNSALVSGRNVPCNVECSLQPRLCW